MLKRMISLLLCAVMLITMLPAQTMAMETEETEVFLEETESVPEETETVPEENTEPTTEETVAVTEPTVAEEPAAAETTGLMVEDVIVTEVAAEAAMGSAEVMAAAAVAQGTCGTDLTWTFNEDTGVLRISGTGAMSDYTSSSIPWCDYGYSIKSVVIEEGVTSIGRSAFSWCTGLTSVTIPSSVTRIGNSAFSYCISLPSVVIPGGVTAIGEYAFSNNPKLVSVTIPEGVTSIGIYAFYECAQLSSVTIPESVTRIGAYAFSRCDSLTGIWVSPDNKDYSSDASGVLFDKNQKQLIRAPGAISGTYLCPETVISISGEAFDYCAQLNSVTIPDRVTSIGNEAFSACSGLVGVSIGSGVSSIGASAFNGCALTSVTIPASVTNIGLCSFYDCNNLTGIWVEESNAYYSNDDRGVLFDKEQTKLIQAPGAISGEYICPASVTSIESYAFGKCANLTNVVFPEHVSIIDAWAFHSCTGLTAVTIPASVVSLSVKTFNCCTNLGAITFQGDAPTFSINTFSMVTATAYYPAGNTTWTESVMQDYEGTITWIPYEEEPDSLTGGDCGDNATWELDDNGVLTISGIGAMEDYTAASEQPWAEYQSGITEIVIGDDVTKIGAYAFSGCDQAVTLTIGEGVTEIGNYAFYNCTGLTQVNYNAVSGSDSVSDNYSFCYAGQSGTGITVTVGSEVERIPAYLFSPRGGTLYSPNIIKLEFEENSVCTEIGHHAFYYVKYMKQIEIPASMTSIGKYAFYHTEELERLDFYAVNMEDLGSMNYVFYEAGSRSSELTVYFGAQVQRIPAYLFCANSGSTSPLITEVVFAENSICQEIGDYAFHWVDKLRDMEIPVSVTKIGDYAFEYCGNLTLLFPEALPEELGEDWSAGAAVCVNPQKRGMTENGFTYWITQDDEAVIGKYRGTETDVTVPAVIENCPVVDVSDGVFYYNEEIVSVILPDGIKRIGISAFENCGNLQQVIIPDTVEYIEGSAFYYCSSLETVILPKNLRSVGNGAFGYGSGYYRFTGNAPWIDSSAFSNATATLAYPANDPTWENAIQKNYSGEITWEPYETCENGHQYEAVYTDPTFDANGFTTYTCSVCGDTYTETDEGTMKSAAASIGSVKYETLAEAFAAAKEGDTILMLKTYTIAKGTAETWDLSGKTLEISGGRGGISVEGNLTVLGGTFRFLEGVQGIMVWANGQVTIENGTFHTVDSRGIWAVYGKITFNGGTFYTTGEGYIGTSERQAGTNKFAQFLINGGTFYFRDSGHFVDYGNSTIKGGTFYLESREGSIRADYSYHRDSLTITGGTFYISGAVGIWIDPAKGHLLIKGGKFITVADSAQILKYEGGTLGISGGTFSQDMTPYLSSSYCCRKSDAYYVVGSHLYQLKNTSETYLKTEAGCTNPAEYYMSCACGKAGTDFFTYGDPLGHSFTNYVSNDNATCTENGTETASCNRGCGATDEREIPDSAKGHSYQNGKCTVCGDESQCGDHLSWKFDADTGTLTISGTGDMTAYTDGGAPWYVYKDSITALNLEEGITSIGDYAFAGCSKVATIVLPDSVTAIHRCGFANMAGLTSVTFGEDLAQLGSPGDTKVVHSPFSQCTSLEEIIFTGTTVPVKYGYPFTNMDMASEATIYVPAEYFREYAAFLTYTVQHAKIISKDATEEFQIRDGVLEAYFGDDAEVTIPDTVTTIGYGAFNNNLNITKVNLHDGVTEIEDYVFCNCSNLTEVQWSGNLTRIGGWSFFHCVGLKEMILPDSVTEIGDYAFSGCTGLTDVTFEGNAPVMHSSTFYRVKATVFYPADDATWTESVRKNYSGTLTWEPYDSTAYRVSLDAVNLGGYGSVWIDGVEYAVQTDGDNCYVDLQDDQAKTMVAYTYHIADASDVHSQYPVGMKVWTLEYTDGLYTATYQPDFDNILRYSGMSIRVTGKKGIRMITSIEKDKKTALVSDGLAGYTLKEYGTVVAWDSQLGAGNPLTLGNSYVKSNFAYKKGVADPVFQDSGNLIQYTNVLVNFSNEQCKNDLAMRSYMILEDGQGNAVTLYGGIVRRSIGYIARQNKDIFEPKTSEYQYIWDIIRYVYGDVNANDFLTA